MVFEPELAKRRVPAQKIRTGTCQNQVLAQKTLKIKKIDKNQKQIELFSNIFCKENKDNLNVVDNLFHRYFTCEIFFVVNFFLLKTPFLLINFMLKNIFV